MMKYMSTMRRDTGVTLVTAIMLLLVLAALGAFIVSLGTTQQINSAFDFQGSQAYHAARTGLEFGAYQAINGSCVGSTSLALPAAQFGAITTVTVTCGPSTTHIEGSPATNPNATKILYPLVATACNQPAGGNCPNNAPGANYIERQLQLTVINPP